MVTRLVVGGVVAAAIAWLVADATGMDFAERLLLALVLGSLAGYLLIDRNRGRR